MIKMKLQYVVWKDAEYDQWLASSIKYDIMTQGRTREAAIESLERTILGQIHLDIKRGLKPLQDIGKPPMEVLEMEIEYTPPLLPCPFCGGEAKFLDRGESGEEFDMGCKTFECFLESGSDWWLSKEEAIKMWNTRVSNDR